MEKNLWFVMSAWVLDNLRWNKIMNWKHYISRVECTLPCWSFQICSRFQGKRKVSISLCSFFFFFKKKFFLFTNLFASEISNKILISLNTTRFWLLQNSFKVKHGLFEKGSKAMVQECCLQQEFVVNKWCCSTATSTQKL